MFDSFYPCISLGCNYRNPFKDAADLLRTDIYRFDTENREFLVEVACYENSIYIVEYYERADKDNKSFERYGKLLGDVNAPRIIRTCFELMLDYLVENASASFAFMGAPTYVGGEQVEAFETTKRFKIYRYVAINLLGTESFEQFEDETSSCYLIANNLTNKEAVRQRAGEILKSSF